MHGYPLLSAASKHDDLSMLECCGGPSADGSAAPLQYSTSGAVSTGHDSAAAAAAAAGMALLDRQNSFILHNPPLAALHNMTQSKVPASPLPTSAAAAAAAAAAASSSSLYCSKQQFAGFPVTHSIHDILSRPPQLPRLTNMYLNNQSAVAAAVSAAGRLGKPLGELPGHSPVYWPGGLGPSLPGTAPNPWRPPSEYNSE